MIRFAQIADPPLHIPSTSHDPHVTAATIFQQVPITGDQRASRFPRRSDKNAVYRICGRYTGKACGCNQHRRRHLRQYHTRKLAETLEPDVGTDQQCDFLLGYQHGDFPRSYWKAQKPLSAYFLSYALYGFPQVVAVHDPNHCAGVKQKARHRRLPCAVPFLADR